MDYFTKPYDKNEENKKNLYIKFLTLTFNQIDRFLKIDGFISFNIFYYAEKYFDQITKDLNKKYIILHKESALVPFHEKSAPQIYKKNNEKSLASKISVFSDSQKKILIKSGIVNKNQIEVNGCPRTDFTFRLRKIEPNKKIIIYYIIESYRSTNHIFGTYDFNWKKLYDQTLRYIIKFAKKNPGIKIILKGKTGIHKKTHFEYLNLPKNCMYIDGGDGEKLLSQAKIAVAFNSTVVYNIIASNRNLVIPNFNNENKIKKKYLLNVINSKYFANSEKEFFEMLNRNLKTKYDYKQISKKDKEVLKYYMGNIDGMSGIRVNNLIRKTLNLK